MLRKRAIRSMLVEEVGGLRPTALPAPESDSDRESHQERPGEPAADEAARLVAEAEVQREALERAERRALLVVGFDWVALVALYFFRDPAAPFLPTGPTIDTVFTLGVMAVAIHSGFRLGQLEKLRAVRRAWSDLVD